MRMILGGQHDASDSPNQRNRRRRSDSPNHLREKSDDINLSDIPDQANKPGWVRASMYKPLMRAISIRLPEPDIALALISTQ